MAVEFQYIVDADGIDVCARVGNALAVTGLQTSHALLFHVHSPSSADGALWEEAQLAVGFHELAGIDDWPSIGRTPYVEHLQHLLSCYRLFHPNYELCIMNYAL